MRISGRQSKLVTALVAALLLSRHATGQQPAEVTPPKIVRSVEAERPDAARALETEARVVLELTIDTDGRVTDA